jgi:hypothetical protein
MSVGCQRSWEVETGFKKGADMTNVVVVIGAGSIGQLPHGHADDWGANREGSPVIGQDGGAIESTVLFVPVRSWSDGSPAPPPGKHRM